MCRGRWPRGVEALFDRPRFAPRFDVGVGVVELLADSVDGTDVSSEDSNLSRSRKRSEACVWANSPCPAPSWLDGLFGGEAGKDQVASTATSDTLDVEDTLHRRPGA